MISRILLFLGLVMSFTSMEAQGTLTCKAPEGLFASARDSDASINWQSAGIGSAYMVQWKSVRSTDWKTETATTNTLLLRGLQPCAEFEFRVKTVCSMTESSAYGESKKFKTLGCNSIAPCSTPREVKGETVENKAYFKWASTGAHGYEVQYQDASNNGAWVTAVVTTNNFAALNLKTCTKYFFKVRSICTSVTATTPVIYSEWSSQITVATTGCNTNTHCEPIRRLSVVSANTGIILKWEAVASATYDVQVKKINESEWRTISGLTTNLYAFTNLAACTVFEARVRVNCSSSSSWSYPMRFVTSGCQPVCVTPRSLKVTLSDNTAVISWVSPQASKFILQYKEETAADWRSVNVATNLYVLAGLTACKKYVARVQAVCTATSISDNSETVKFETRGCVSTVCEVPRDLKVAIVDNNIAVVNWAAATGNKFEVQYRIIGSGDLGWKSVLVSTLETKLQLDRCKGYEWKVRKICEGAISEWSAIGKFETRGCVSTVCEAPHDLKVAIVDNNLAVVNWTAAMGNKFEVQYRIIGSGDLGWKSVLVSTLETKLQLDRCKGYEWKVRKICEGATSDWSAIGKFETTGCVAPTICEVPHDLKVSVVEDNIALVNWIGAAGNKFEVQYRIIGSGDNDWKQVYVSTLEAKLVLERCKGYEWRVRKLCTVGTSDWSVSGKFETRGCIAPSICPTPLNVKVAMVTDGVSITWSDMVEHDNVVVQYAGPNDAAYHEVIGTTPNGVLLRGLQGCTTYKIRVVRKCANGIVSAAFETAFKTSGANCFLDGDAGVGVNSLQKRTAIKNIGISPNPGSEYIQVQYDLEEVSEVQIQLLNLQGQVVKQLDGGAQDAGTYMQVLDNLTNINQGMYFLVIRANGKVTTTQKWMKQ